MHAECLPRLTAIGIAYHDAIALRRIAMTLHRWHELECGTEDGVVQREDDTGRPYWYSAHTARMATVRCYIPDREAGALKRLAATMAKYPHLSAYVQGDPRGAALYILRPGDVPDGERAKSYYTRGIAVYK